MKDPKANRSRNDELFTDNTNIGCANIKLLFSKSDPISADRESFQSLLNRVGVVYMIQNWFRQFQPRF